LRPTSINLRLRRPPPIEQTISGLAISTASLDLGEVAEQTDCRLELPIHNLNDQPTEIIDFAVSCGCVEAVEPRTMTIGPGKTAMLRLKVNLAKRYPSERGLVNRPFEVEIRPIQKTPAPKQSGWRLHGTIKSRITLDTQWLDFGDAPVHGQSPVARKVIATVHVPGTSLAASIKPDIATVKVKAMDGSNDQFELVVTPHPTLPVGPFSGNIQVDLIANDAARLPGVVLPIAGKMQPEVRAIPAHLAFGGRQVGGYAESTVTLQVPVGEDWVVDHIEIDSADVRVAADTAAGALAARVFHIRQAVTQTGASVQRDPILRPQRQGRPRAIGDGTFLRWRHRRSHFQAQR